MDNMKKRKRVIQRSFGAVGLLSIVVAVVFLSMERESAMNKHFFSIQHRLDDKLGSGSTSDPYNGNRLDEVITEIKRRVAGGKRCIAKK